ncbi:protein O-mannose kinase-like [Branchiostoma lanceolatum]|uniref:protein O-mannose kinase-like n=1 Tax=Branchiostoma lanceolatum TaxID=7740 RepID=UPI003456A83F
MWIWSESHSHANQQPGIFSFEDDDTLSHKIQGKAKEPNPDVADVVEKEAEKEVESLGKLGENKGLCPAGSFRLAAMEACAPWLGCKDIADEVAVQDMLDWGGVKKVYRATWRGHTVAYSNLTRKHFPWRDFFLNDVAMLRTLQQSPHVVQMVGSCNTTFLTEYHRLGSADKIEAVLAREEFSKFNNVRTRFNLAVSYLRAMHYLHNSPVGKLVLCDSNRLKKALSQFLITEDFKLVLNDLDSVLEANTESQLFMRCNFNRIQPKSDFSAPEQRFPFQHGRLNYSMMPSYNEKMDIWKIPTVVDYLLGKVNGSDVVRLNLFKVHRQCKNKDPKKRPSARILLKEYKRIRNMVFPD